MSLSTILLPIQSDLKEVDRLIAENVSSDVGLVADAANYALGNGGKRLRPALVLLSSKMLGFSGPASRYIGAAIEMIHTASLMHDDVLDNAQLRRGKPSINAKWGNQISILVGDFLWCKASKIVIEHGNNKILSSITTAVEKTTEGEILEIVKSNDFDIGEEEYIKIVKLKTAVLFACSCHNGALLAGASEQHEEALRRFGTNLGIAFQLADDVLDYTCSEEKFGKKAGIDLSEGKITLPIILTLKRCSEEEKMIIKDALVSNTTKKLGQINSILKSHGAIDDSLELATSYAERARSELSLFKSSIERDALERLASFTTTRKE